MTKRRGKPPSDLTNFIAPRVRELWEGMPSSDRSLSERIISIHEEFYHVPELRTMLPHNKTIQKLRSGDGRSKTKTCVLFNTIANLVQK